MSLPKLRRSDADGHILVRGETGSMIWIWVALLSLVGGWLGIVPVYSPPHWSASAFFIFAVVLFAIAFRQTDIAPLPSKYVGFLLPIALSILLIPWPYNVGPVFLAGFLIVIMIGRRSLLVRRIALALGASGLMMLLESASQPLLFQIFAHYHDMPWAARIEQLMFRSIGVDASVSSSILHRKTFEALIPINVTCEALGLYAVAVFMIAGIVLLSILRVSRLRWLACLAILILYPLVRYQMLILAYEEIGQTVLFWSSWVTVLTFIPMAVLIWRLVTPDILVTDHVIWPQLDLRMASVRASLISCAAAVCIVGLFSFQDPGASKRGRILIDESHSNWEWTTRKYDTKWYNEASGYNYYCLADYLNHFYHVDRGSEKITAELLESYDVLVLKTLTRPLQQEEMDAIVDFVRDGGGLWLVGDHTNVFGISAHMNPLAQRFGMSFKYVATYDLTSGGLTVYRPSVMLPHPTVQYMPPVFLFGTSCSMDAPIWADCPVIGYSLLSRRDLRSKKCTRCSSCCDS